MGDRRGQRPVDQLRRHERPGRVVHRDPLDPRRRRPQPVPDAVRPRRPAGTEVHASVREQRLKGRHGPQRLARRLSVPGPCRDHHRRHVGATRGTPQAVPDHRQPRQRLEQLVPRPPNRVEPPPAGRMTAKSGIVESLIVPQPAGPHSAAGSNPAIQKSDTDPIVIPNELRSLWAERVEAGGISGRGNAYDSFPRSLGAKPHRDDGTWQFPRRHRAARESMPRTTSPITKTAHGPVRTMSRLQSGRWDSSPRRSAWKADTLPLSYARRRQLRWHKRTVGPRRGQRARP